MGTSQSMLKSTTFDDITESSSLQGTSGGTDKNHAPYGIGAGSRSSYTNGISKGQSINTPAFTKCDFDDLRDCPSVEPADKTSHSMAALSGQTSLHQSCETAEEHSQRCKQYFENSCSLEKSPDHVTPEQTVTTRKLLDTDDSVDATTFKSQTLTNSHGSRCTGSSNSVRSHNSAEFSAHGQSGTLQDGGALVTVPAQTKIPKLLATLNKKNMRNTRDRLTDCPETETTHLLGSN